MAIKTMKEFGRIGVLMGGPSEERPISLKSAHAVYDSLRTLGCDVVGIDITTEDPAANMALIRSHGIDCAFIALHGRFGEDGQIQQVLEDLRVPYTGSGVEASKRAMDKAASLALFSSAGLAVAEYIVADRNVSGAAGEISVPFALPWVVKPVRQGSSIGLSIIDSSQQLGQALRLAFETDERALVQHYIEGRELTVAILDEKPLPIVEIVTTRKFFDYEAKYSQGFTDYIVPAQIGEATAAAVQRAALAAHRSLGCFGCSRVDVILSEDNIPYVLELNNIPGLTQTSLLPKAARCAGIDFSQLCVRMLSLAYEKK
ncbi:MAG: D-alanine--D-alanine ligase [Candidatus Omnitrophota bacterium]